MILTRATTHLDLVLDDVPAGAQFFRHVLALPVRPSGDDGVEVHLAEDVVAHLRPRAGARPARPDGPGPLLQVQVPAVRPAVAELRRRGATVLIEPVLTDWGTESAFVAGPGDLVVEVYRPAPD